jgi:hypothetical protein
MDASEELRLLERRVKEEMASVERRRHLLRTLSARRWVRRILFFGAVPMMLMVLTVVACQWGARLRTRVGFCTDEARSGVVR